MPQRCADGGAAGLPHAPRVSVVVPALNEARNLRHVLEQIGTDVFEVIVVDGNSIDDTVGMARRALPDVRVICQTRHGKGNALACGFHACRGDIIVMLDADGSTDASEIPWFVSALVSGAHFAKGSRFAPGGGSDDITLFRHWGNSALNSLVNGMFGTSYGDLCYGYNAFWRDCLPYLDVAEPGFELPPDEVSPACEPSDEVRWGDGFEIETLLTVRVAMLGMRVTEVASYELDRLHGRSNLHACRDGLRVLRTIAAERRLFASKASSRGALPEPWLRFRSTEVEDEQAPVAAVEVIDLAAIEREELAALEAERERASRSRHFSDVPGSVV